MAPPLAAIHWLVLPAISTLQVIQEENLVNRSAELGAYFLERLQQIESPLIRQVRGLGLMIGIELKERACPSSMP